MVWFQWFCSPPIFHCCTRPNSPWSTVSWSSLIITLYLLYHVNHLIWLILYESNFMIHIFERTWHNFWKTKSIYLFLLSILRQIRSMLLLWFQLLLLKRSIEVTKVQRKEFNHKPLLSHISLSALIKSCTWHSIMKIMELCPRPVIGPRKVAKLGAFGWKVP